MSSKATRITIGALVLFLAFVIIAMSMIIYNTPVVVTAVTAGNYPGTLMNGGHVLDDQGFLFYNAPNTSGIYRIESTDLINKVKITQDGTGNLQIVGKKYYYSDNNSLKVCKFDGTSNETLIEYAKNPLVVGGLIYYINKDGSVCKSDINGKNVKVLDIKPQGQILVFANRIYYIGDKNYIYSAAVDGSDKKVFVKQSASKFLMDGRYMFFLSDNQVFSASVLGAVVTNKILGATDFIVKDNFMLYNEDGNLYLADIDKINKTTSADIPSEKYNPIKLLSGTGTGFGLDKDNFYFYKKDILCRVPTAGGDIQEIK